MVFYEEGEPIIDGEAGDLRVISFHNIIIIIVLFISILLTVGKFSGSSVFVQQHMRGLGGKAITFIQLPQ